MRDFLLIALVLLSLPVGLIKPFYGILVYSWISYMYPHLWTWSYAQTAPVAKLAALSVIAGVVIRRNGSLEALKEREMILMFLLLLLFTLSSFFALYPDEAWAKWQDMVKVILMSFVIAGFLTDRKKIRLFLIVIALSLGFYGFKGGIFSMVTGGQYMIWGPANSIIGANNNLGLALNMVLPIFWYLAKSETNMWLKRGFQVCFLLTIPAIMFTYSRGSFLGMAAVLALIILKGRHRILSAAVLLAAVIAVTAWLPQRWVERTGTTLEYRDDPSAMSRIDNWRFCWKLALDRPLTGGGFKFFSVETLRRYDPEFVLRYGTAWDTHNIFFGILAGHGFPAFIVFMMMIFFTWTSCWRMKKKARGTPPNVWIADYSDLVQVAFWGWMINGMFVNMEYFELPYHLIAVTAALKVIYRRESTGLSPGREVGQEERAPHERNVPVLGSGLPHALFRQNQPCFALQHASRRMIMRNQREIAPGHV